jgi:hypothetical protein
VSLFSLTCNLPQCNAGESVKDRCEEEEVKAVPQTLDIAKSGDRTTAVETLEAVHGLAQNMNVVTEGE